LHAALHSTPQTTARDVRGVAAYRSRRGAQTADRLAFAARSCGSSVALAVSDKIAECSRAENIWTASDLHRDDGELFDGTGTYAACGSRLCPSCCADTRRRSRRRARAALASVVLESAEDFRFVTLTMPTVDAPLVETLAVFQQAWSLLRKRRFWLSAVRAGVKGIEFTVTPSGYHVHAHLLLVSRWIAHAELRAEWTYCVRKAWADECGHYVKFNTPTGEAVVDVRLVRNRRGSSAKVVSVEAALQEVCKYITKGETWDAVPDADLVAIAEVRRWARLFEVFGDMRPRRVSRNEPARADAGAAVASLDTPYLCDGSPGEREAVRVRADALIDVALRVDRLTWLAILSRRFAERRAYRRAALVERYPLAVFESLAGEVTYGCARAPVSPHRLTFATLARKE
jgi:hypothetical protein